MAIPTTNRYHYPREEYERQNWLYLVHERAKIILDMPVRLRGYQKSYDRHGYSFKFEIDDRIFDGFLGEVESIEGLRINEIPKPRCVSCGKEGLCFGHDILGRCENTIKIFWGKVRKVYWHRYSKNKN